MEAGAGAGAKANESQGRGYWSRGWGDLFPEESFQSWGAYGRAIADTPHRLKDRFQSRSSDDAELGSVRSCSEHEMKRCLTWWDITWFGFGSVVGSGIFVLTGQEAHNHAGPSIVLSYLAAGVSAMLSVFCYTEFAVEIPVAGGSFAYLRVELGDFAAFIVAANLILKSILGSAAVARSWTSYFTTLLNRPSDALRIQTNLAQDFNLLDPIAVVILAITAAVAMLSTKKTSHFNRVASAVLMVVIVFVIAAGFAHAEPRNMKPFFPFGVPGVFTSAAIVYFAYGGFDNVATMAEETKNPSTDIPLGLLGSMTIITTVYCLMALSLSMMQRYSDMDVNAAYSVAFRNVGMKWAQYIVALGALKGMTTALLVSALGQARYATHIARSHMIPPIFALVHPKTGTPIYATIFITFCSACIAFFSSLDVLASLLSISTLFVFMMTAMALLVRRYYVSGVSTKKEQAKLVGFLLLIVASSMGMTAYWGLRPHGWVGYAVTVPVWVLATLGLQLFVPQRRKAKVWGVPLVPWLPSLSIATNLFLMGSLGYKDFVRFAICTGFMLVYYVLFGVHATYDVAHGGDGQIGKVDGSGDQLATGGERA